MRKALSCTPLFLAASAVPLLANAGIAWAFLPGLVTVFIALDACLGEVNPPPPRPRNRAEGLHPLTFFIPLQLALIVWGAAESRNGGAGRLVLLALDIGVTSGIFGMLASHELIHARRPAERGFGMILLAASGYMHFRISHVHIHHRLAATLEDPATARHGEGSYRFMLRSIAGQWRLARATERLRLAGKRLPWLADRTHHGLLLSTAIAVSIWAAFGVRALLFLALHAVIAILILELFNYVAHYGLLRQVRPDGRSEPLDRRHSWNTQQRFSNWVLLNAGHHSDHHRRPAEPYHALRPVPHAPLLPAGYAATFCLALVPPLWRKIMDPRAAAAMRSATS